MAFASKTRQCPLGVRIQEELLWLEGLQMLSLAIDSRFGTLTEVTNHRRLSGPWFRGEAIGMPLRGGA